MDTRTQRTIRHDILGAILGFVVGAIVAVNVVIFSGIDRGYEASVPEVFRENAFVGLLTVAVLVAGPILGVVVSRRSRRGR